MKKLLNNTMFRNYFVLLIFMCLLEVAFRLISGITLKDYALLRIFIGLNIISLVLSYIFSYFKKNVRIACNIVVCLVFSVYAFIEMGFNNFLGVYASFNTSSQLGAVTSYVKDFLASFLGKYYLIFIPFIGLIIYYIFLDKYPKVKDDKRFMLKHKFKYGNLIKTVISVVILVVYSISYDCTLTVSFMQSDLQTVSNEDLFAYPSVPSLVVNQFGIIGFGLLDVKSLGTQNNTTVNIAYTQTEVVDTEREFDDTLWEEVIEEEEDETLNTISNYLINQTITDYNDYTGLFEGKNLIVIMMESVNDIFINEELYPNFYKLYSEGISFSNNYSPRNSCATGNNEFSGMTSLYTIQNNCTANVYKNNTYYTSIFNLFNDAGYTTVSMHDYTEAYYYRSTIHTNLGVDYYYGVQDLGITYYTEYKNWASDEDFMEAAMDIMLDDYSEDEPFMLWMTTVSSHQPYSVSSVEGDKYLDITEDTDYPDDLRRYMSKLKTLDNALGILLDRLEEAGILDDTVIVLYGDHYPYGLKNSTLEYVLDYDLDDYEVERVPMVIYNSEIDAEVIDKYSSYINLTPTIANLFNLDYDPRLYMGSDVLSDEYESLVVFADGSWKNEYAYYDASSSSITYYTDFTYTTDEIIEINNKITSKMQISELIIENNYYEYLSDALENKSQGDNILAEGG